MKHIIILTPALTLVHVAVHTKYAEELLYKGQVGDGSFVPWREVVPSRKYYSITMGTGYRLSSRSKVVLFSECPLSQVPLYT